MRINDKFTTGDRIAPGERFIGDRESWLHIQILRADRPLPQSVEYPAEGYEGGPGRPFARRAYTVQKGRFLFVRQSGGLDV